MFNVVVPTRYGLMCVNRNDYCPQFPGVGKVLLDTGEYYENEMSLLRQVIGFLPRNGVALDIGANVGVHSLEFAKHFNEGKVYSFEPQRLVYYQLVANVALNSVTNIYPQYMAVGKEMGSIQVPQLNPHRPASFGSLEIGHEQVENIGQWPHEGEKLTVPMTTVDDFCVELPSFMKIDVEGMEIGVIEGARKTIMAARPIMFVEFLKSDSDALRDLVKSFGYDAYMFVETSNYLFVPSERMKIQGLPAV